MVFQLNEERKRLRKSFAARGEEIPPEGSRENPGEQQMLDRFVVSLPQQPKDGMFQVRTAGTGIMHAPKSVVTAPVRDLSDFMLAMLIRKSFRSSST